MLEVFDFIAYGTFAVMIGRAFFPAHDAFLSLLLSVATFGVGFVTRPLGAWWIGSHADRHGTRSGMLLSLGLMGAGSLMIAILPPYRAIGVAAPLLLVVARLIQGLAWGGEAGPATVFLMQCAPAGRQGRLIAWQGASQAGAVLLTGLAGVALSALPGALSLSQDGWRIAFLLGVAMLPLGLWLRSGAGSAPGSPPAPRPEASASEAASGRTMVRILACGLVLMAGGTVTQYFLNFATSYAISVLHLPLRHALEVSVGIGIAAVLGALVSGLLCDRRGSRAVSMWPRVLVGLLVVPGLWLSATDRSGAAFALFCVALAWLQASGFVGSLVLLLQALPPHRRTTRFGMVYAVAIAAFGGTAQVVFVTLIRQTGSNLSPAWYLAGMNLCCVAASLAMPGRPLAALTAAANPAPRAVRR